MIFLLEITKVVIESRVLFVVTFLAIRNKLSLSQIIFLVQTRFNAYIATMASVFFLFKSKICLSYVHLFHSSQIMFLVQTRFNAYIATMASVFFLFKSRLCLSYVHLFHSSRYLVCFVLLRGMFWHSTLNLQFIHTRPRSSVGIETDYGLDCPGSNPGGDEIFRPSTPALGPTQPPVQWLPGLSQR